MVGPPGSGPVVLLPSHGQTYALTVLLCLEAIAVPAAASVPETSTLFLLQVKVPTHGVVLTGADLLDQQTGVCR